MIASFSDLKGKVCVITGGAGVLGQSMGLALAQVGALTVVLDMNIDRAREVAASIEKSTGTKCIGVAANVLDRSQLEAAHLEVKKLVGPVDILINGAGGNSPKATTQLEQMAAGSSELAGSFFDLDIEGFKWVYDLNFTGTLLPTMVFAKDMLVRGKGVILNISSMNSFKPLTKIAAYSAAKASINNFTQWLAVHLGRTGIRVNAIAPGFFLTNQNRFLLTNEKTGEPTPRGKKIISNTPMGKYGEPSDLQGATLFLLSDISSFITGIVLPVDGGYSAFGGV